MRKLALLAALFMLTGCATLDTSGVVTAKPEPFPFPGIYSGAVSNGILTYRISEDGTGRSCFRNKFSGQVFRGDLKYDGARIYTEDGTMVVDSVSADRISAHAAFVRAELHRVESPPSVCADFLGATDA